MKKGKFWDNETFIDKKYLRVWLCDKGLRIIFWTKQLKAKFSWSPWYSLTLAKIKRFLSNRSQQTKSIQCESTKSCCDSERRNSIRGISRDGSKIFSEKHLPILGFVNYFSKEFRGKSSQMIRVLQRKFKIPISFHTLMSA